MSYRVLDVSLADEGRRKIQWALSHMPVLQSLTRQYEKSMPLEGVRVAGCLHVTKETAVLVESLKALGAVLSWCGCNPLSTQDDVAASLAGDDKISIYASRGVSTQEYYDDIHMAMKIDPNIPSMTELILRWKCTERFKNSSLCMEEQRKQQQGL